MMKTGAFSKNCRSEATSRHQRGASREAVEDRQGEARGESGGATPWFMHPTLVTFSKENEIFYSRVARAQELIDPTLARDRQFFVNTSAAQMLVAFSLANDFITLLKSVNAERQKTNLGAVNTKLTPDRVAKLAALDEYLATCNHVDFQNFPVQQQPQHTRDSSPVTQTPPKKPTGRYFKREDRRTVMSQSQPHPSPCHEPEPTPSTPAKPIDLGSPTSATESSACMASPCFSFMFASKCERNGRASSAGSSDLDELGDAPVQQLPPDHKEIPHLDLNKPSTDVTDGMASPLDNTQPLAYQGALSPRQQSGKRYHGGYLQHRVPMAVGLLKSWKRKYFRLREHGLVCYKTQDSATPLFEVKFTAHSVLVLDKSQGDRTSSSSSFSTRPSTGRQAGACADSSEKHRRTSWPIPSSGALVLVLKHVEVTGHQTPAKAVEVPVFLKAEDEADRTAWTECMRYMIEAHKRALFQANLEKGQSDEDTDELMSPAQPLTSADTAMELSAQRGSETSSKEVIKMPRRRRSSGSAVAPDLLPMLNNLVEVETF
ncbi:hypothetical protein PR001_g27592, partial [Phytophthora rubi]